jgi:hypothetical protein
MAEADCEICAGAGYGVCDVCGGVAFELGTGPFGLDFCGYCLAELKAGKLSHRRGVGAG